MRISLAYRLIVAAMIAGNLVLGAQGSSVGVLPSSRAHVILEPSDRNPYAKQEVPKIEVEEQLTDAQSEESRITAVLETLRVVGRTRSETGWKVLLGDVILEAGGELPPLVDGQTRVLRVVDIFDTMIEIEWVTTEPTETPKRTFIPVRLTPAVATALAGSTDATPAVVTRTVNPTTSASDGSPTGN